MDTREKLEILTDAAKYDVACTSSGLDRNARLGQLGTTTSAGICHSFAADGRCITLLKVLLTNICIYDCAYCCNRASNDIPRAAFGARELADLTIGFYRRNMIEGLFISSGVVKSPDHTMELMYEVARILRLEYGFRGYIHAKAIPGASKELLDRLGLLVDRMSVNIELPSATSLKLLAPQKDKDQVLAPMAHLKDRIEAGAEERRLSKYGQPFVPAGQSTQLIIGASPEDDRHILLLSKTLYEHFSLKRVFFSAYQPLNDNVLLPDASCQIPLDREHRLYQADWLMRFYGFDASELVDDTHKYLDPHIDPKAAWALRHPELFPIEVNTAPFELLVRIPGLGVQGARKVERTRRECHLRPETMRRLHLSLKRMKYFVTFDGVSPLDIPFDPAYVYRRLAADAAPGKKRNRGGGKRVSERQLSFFEEEALPMLDALPLQPGQIRAFEAQALAAGRLGQGGAPAGKQKVVA